MNCSGAVAVIGKNFGDEGKGLAVNWLCACSGRAAVIRHNGGAQAGHTVETEKDRFVFHQLSSGSLRGADTLWADTFMPDLYKLGEEAESFFARFRFLPRIYCHPDARVVTVDDVLINMALESSRGSARHGSCGMGINEACERDKAGFGLAAGEIMAMSADSLARRLGMMRRQYSHRRMEQLGLGLTGEYGELLRNDDVVRNEAEIMIRNRALVSPLDDGFADRYDRIVFEGAQGLLLDSENKEYAPHVTASRTGLDNPVSFCRRRALELTDAVYVTRSYVTRHGAGPLRGECPRETLGAIPEDRTNAENPWQGKMRYAPHVSPEEFTAPVKADLRKAPPNLRAHLLVTHLNETGGVIRFSSGDVSPADLSASPDISAVFGHLWTSDSPYAVVSPGERELPIFEYSKQA